jgi:5-methylcytosine-specific restriction endonuclease McrA
LGYKNPENRRLVVLVIFICIFVITYKYITLTIMKVLPDSEQEKQLITKYLNSSLSMLAFAKQEGLKRGIIERIVKRNNLNKIYEKGKPALTRKEFELHQKLYTKDGQPTKFIYLERKSVKKDKKTSTLLHVQCVCGTEKWLPYSAVMNGNTRTCGKAPCFPFEDKKSVVTSHKGLYRSYVYHAKERNIDFNLSLNELIKISSNNCVYCNKQPSQLYQILDAKTKKVRSGVPFYYNGIDRVDNSIGYNKENCVACCKQCNRCKGKMTLVEFKTWIKAIHDNLF